MKPSRSARRSWSFVLLTLAGFAMLLWGCGHTRQIVYPGRKVSPPQMVETKPPGSKWKAVAPPAADDRIPTGPERQPEAPTSIDVPIIDRNGR